MADEREPLLAGLNEAQKEAVFHTDSPLLILAGAGSGKTRVITVKIAWLIRKLGYDPRSILALTFTNKAAQEMRTRAALLEAQAASVLIKTFHSFGAWFLRRNAAAAGLSPSFTIYDDDDVLSLLSRLFPQQNKQLLGLYARMISRAKDYALSPYDDLRPVMEKPDLPEIYEKYESKLRQIGNCDFGDLINLGIRLLKDEPVLAARVRDRFKVILVDEYQDSNVAQYELLRLLCGPDTLVAVVGDDDQSIYRFRGAEVKNILSFPERFPGTKIIRLEQNYRSTNPILKLAGAVVAHNANRLGKTMWTDKVEGEKPRLYLFSDEDQEAQSLVQLIAHFPFEESAILYRTNAQSRVYETALLRAGIPYRIVGTLRFYEREEIKDSLAFLRLVANKRDELAFRRVVNKPARGLGPASLDKALEALDAFGGDVLNCARASLSRLSKKAGEGLSEFLELLEKLTGLFPEVRADFSDAEPEAPDGTVGEDESREAPSEADGDQNLGFIIDRVLQESGLKAYYEAEDKAAGTQRFLNLEELSNAASLFPASFQGLVDFLEAVELDSGRERENGDDKKVTLITMHNTKGLEFDRVFITGLEEGLFPREQTDEDEIEEERRLFYVALTRARLTLTLSSCAQRRLHGRIIERSPSRFLREIPEEFVDVVQVSAASYGAYSSYSSRGAQGYRSGTVVRAPGSAGTSKFPKGTPVYHDDYGPGMVVKSWFSGADELVLVRFESGRSAQFIPKYSTLERLSP